MIRLLFLLLALSTSAFADDALIEPHAPVKLERIVDGDTILASGRKIRLWGIDAPEMDESAGKVAKTFLGSILNNGTELRCKFIEKDKYKRDVMHCTSDGLDIGSMMVQMGMAKDYSRYSGDYYQYEENLAKEKQRGIWKTYTDNR
ncbi:MAG: thermonuclease family protein [Pseudomonadota bacterium]|nr:thermonuclease family protein [Pseudomonadota bacterium]